MSIKSKLLSGDSVLVLNALKEKLGYDFPVRWCERKEGMSVGMENGEVRISLTSEDTTLEAFLFQAREGLKKTEGIVNRFQFQLRSNESLIGRISEILEDRELDDMQKVDGVRGLLEEYYS